MDMLPEKYTYLTVDICCILVPFLFSFHPRIKFYKQWKYFVLPSVLTAIFFLVWDIAFTRSGVWSFNPRYLIGASLFGLPMEEYLFFFIVPYCCVYTYYCMSKFFNFKRYTKAANEGAIFLASVLMLVGLSHMARLYTSVTFLLLVVLLAFLVFKRVKYLPVFFVSFAMILVPFFISNGILTGSFIKEPVVGYNNKYNLGIRMFTIPIEDTFYGMLLMLMNVAGFEYLKRRKGH